MKNRQVVDKRASRSIIQDAEGTPIINIRLSELDQKAAECDLTDQTLIRVKKYGEEHNFEPLIKRKWDATEIDGWEMAGISALLLNAKGCYRVPTENTYSFMIFKEVIDLRN